MYTPVMKIIFFYSNGFSLLATCVDGIKNQGELGVDCGGPCHACPTGESKKRQKLNTPRKNN